ncbi:MAG TPA: glycosyltransferase family A protein [Steroidobacteraceae bacterium]|nr:glycosyltransferase family A protein [Steroidobacteraceae bacterium]
MPRISVVIPTYNRAALLREAIESALRQDWRDLEVVVVDDGSTDATPDVARAYAGRIVYQRQSNRGVNSARNAAIGLATGEFIALLDSDDVWLPHAASLLASVLGRFPLAGFAYGDFLVLRNGTTAGPGLRAWHDAAHPLEAQFERRHRHSDLQLQLPGGTGCTGFDVYEGDIYHASLFGPRVPTSGSLIRRAAMGGLAFPEHDSLCGDWEFFARLSHRAGAVYADLPVMLNRSHEDEVRLTRVNAATQLAQRIDLVDRVWRQDPDFLARHGAEVDARQFELLFAYARNRLLANDVAAARDALTRAAAMRRGRAPMPWLALRLASCIPGAPLALRAMRRLRDIVARRVGGGR